MRIDDDLKLTFRDVLIRPKRSTLKSRSDVTLIREFKFRHTKMGWKGVPVVAANMDTTGTFDQNTQSTPLWPYLANISVSVPLNQKHG